ncbi:hypothetical protein EP837_03018 [Sphingobium sp. EP60837]|nr:hypothetical protein EP837_03018 [Sphingobium sp. EP60837]
MVNILASSSKAARSIIDEFVKRHARMKKQRSPDSCVPTVAPVRIGFKLR